MQPTPNNYSKDDSEQMKDFIDVQQRRASQHLSGTANTQLPTTPPPTIGSKPTASKRKRRGRWKPIVAIAVGVIVIFYAIWRGIVATQEVDLGGLNLDGSQGYCVQKIKYDGALQITGTPNWECITSQTMLPLQDTAQHPDMAQACDQEYGGNLTPSYQNPGLHGNWRCLDQNGNDRGGLDKLDSYCQSMGYDQADPVGGDQGSRTWQCQRLPTKLIIMNNACISTYNGFYYNTFYKWGIRFDIYSRQTENNAYHWHCFGHSLSVS